jgi:hypothetical protein
MESPTDLDWVSLCFETEISRCALDRAVGAQGAALRYPGQARQGMALHDRRLSRSIDRRKELYEKLYPETTQGKAPGAGRGKRKRSEGSQNEIFVKETAKKTGKGRSTVARAATRGKRGRTWLSMIAGTCLDQGAEIDALLKLPDHRSAVIDHRSSVIGARWAVGGARCAVRFALCPLP